VKKALPNHPYSRAKIREDTGLSERTQIRHQEMILPGSRRKVTPKKENYATYKVELKSKRHSSWAQKRLGNSYTSNLSRRGWGQGKAFNKEQSGSRPHARDATGSSCTGRLAVSSRRPKTSSRTAGRTDRCTRTRCCGYRLVAGTCPPSWAAGPISAGGRSPTCSGQWPHEGFSFLSHVHRQVSIGRSHAAVNAGRGRCPSLRGPEARPVGRNVTGLLRTARLS
jgi:hypothetical protein